jgi:hypothetical protein
MFRHRSAIFRESRLLSVFVGQYTEYTNMHGISNTKLLHTHSFIYHCHCSPASLKNYGCLGQAAYKHVTGKSSPQFRMTALVQALRLLRMRISHLSSRYCDSCACASHLSFQALRLLRMRLSHLSSRHCDSCACVYHISRPGTATPAYQCMRNKLSLADDHIVTQ